ncbi:MAG TPA: DM13 domain-containing protein [Solirubrobacteraceae bacterium]|nr:DM13 domain-containing protein [Solirubrobacteraceae bacterium]
MRVAGAVLCALVLGVTGCGSDAEERPPSDPFKALERDFEATPTPEYAAPRWERVTALIGSGAASRPVEIDEHAIQWRTRWRCDGGIRLRVEPPPAGPSTAEGACPGRATFIGHGARTLSIEADGPWRIVVEQEVETRLDEPALAAMRDGSARLLAKGDFDEIERPSRGTATLYELPSGRLALRLKDFRTSASIGLFVWVSRAARLRTTRAALASRHRQIAELKSTLGDQNYVLPASVRAADARSIVIWCEPVRIAYTAAPMRAQR